MAGEHSRRGLLLYLSSDRDLHRFAVAPALVALGETAGMRFECYYDSFRSGRHFGGGDPRAGRPGGSSGSLVVGGRHGEQLTALAVHFDLLLVGDPHALLWPVAVALGAEVVAASVRPEEVFKAAAERLGVSLPHQVAVLDASPQGPGNVVSAPYLGPRILREAVLAVDVSLDAAGREVLESAGVSEFCGWGVDPTRAALFPGGLDDLESFPIGSYAQLTATLAEGLAGWGRGTLLADPDLVGAQLPKLARLHLVPLHGRPQVEVLSRAATIVARGADPVYGRQWDDRDFLAVSALGRGLQVVDPDPPFDLLRDLPQGAPAAPSCGEPEIGDDQLEDWANEGRVLATLLLWSGMIREVDGAGRLVDLAAVTGLRGGLLLTLDSLEHALPTLRAALDGAPERGGVAGLLEVLLASTGRGVAAEALLPDLGSLLRPVRQHVAATTGWDVAGWWPLLDAPLQERKASRLGRRGVKPVIWFTPREAVGASTDDRAEATPRRTVSAGTRVRAIGGRVVRATPLQRLFEERRPFHAFRPGEISPAVARAVEAAGFRYMWTKANFGECRLPYRDRDFVAVPFTAGNWDGWSPFYTVGSVADIATAERRLLRAGGPGWLASTVDGPLWTMTGEIFEAGAELHRMAEVVAAGGTTGRLVNVTPSVVARYARLLDDRKRTGV